MAKCYKLHYIKTMMFFEFQKGGVQPSKPPPLGAPLYIVTSFIRLNNSVLTTQFAFLKSGSRLYTLWFVENAFSSVTIEEHALRGLKPSSSAKLQIRQLSNMFWT